LNRTSRGLLSALRASGLVVQIRLDGRKYYAYFKGLDLDKARRVIEKKAKGLNPLVKKVLTYTQAELQEMAREKGVSVRRLISDFKEEYLVVRVKYPHELRYVLFRGVKPAEAFRILREVTLAINGQLPERKN